LAQGLEELQHCEIAPTEEDSLGAMARAASLEYYQTGLKHYKAGLACYEKWRLSEMQKDNAEATGALRRAMEALLRVEARCTPSEFGEAEARIQDIRKKLRELQEGEVPRSPASKVKNLGAFTVENGKGTLKVVTNSSSTEWIGKAVIILEPTMKRGESRFYRLLVEKNGDLEVCITPGYRLNGGGLRFGATPDVPDAGVCVFEGFQTRYMRFIRLRIPGGTQIENVGIKREQNSSDDFQFIFKLFHW
jgi:hypothetical protein